MGRYLVLLMLRNIQPSFEALTIQPYKGLGNSWISNSSSESVWFIFKGLSYYLECKGWKDQNFTVVETVQKRSIIHATSNCLALELVLTFSACWWYRNECNWLWPLPDGAYILVGTMTSSVSPSLAWKLDEKPDFLTLSLVIIPLYHNLGNHRVWSDWLYKQNKSLVADIFMYAFLYGLTDSFESTDKITHILYKCI